MSVLKMKEQDLLELYQLVKMYRQCHEEKERGISLEEMLGTVEEEYRERTGGDIKEAGNPGKAGRKRKYKEETEREILKLYQGGKSLRQTAREAGCSVGHVQDVIKREEGHQVYGN